MNFNKDFINAVTNGKRLDEIKNLPPVAKVQLALDIGLEMDKDTIDEKAIAEIIKERNNPKKVTD
jgi:hypothetical protein